MPSRRQQQILTLIREDPMISQQALADRLGISRSAVAGHVMQLSEKGVIKGRGYVLSEHPFVAAIGGANIDVHARPDAAAILQDSNPGTVRSSPGGVARNVAENLARLGVECRLLSAVGSGRQGDGLLRHCREAGVDIDRVYRSDSAPTSAYVSMLDDRGDLHVAVNDMSVMDQFGPRELQKSEAMLKQATLIIADANLREDALDWLATSMRGKTIFADTVSTAKAARLRHLIGAVHTLKTNPREVEALTGLDATDASRRGTVARRLHERGVQRVFISLGSGGLFYSTLHARGTVRSSTAHDGVRNTSGAGDALLAGLAHAWLDDLPLEESIDFALALASLTVGNEQSSSPDLSIDAVRALLARRHAG